MDIFALTRLIMPHGDGPPCQAFSAGYALGVILRELSRYTPIQASKTYIITSQRFIQGDI
jgi:hypothetical protein